MKLVVPLLFCVFLLAGISSSCKHNPVTPNPKCDTCKCDTCKDTTHVSVDTTSHNFAWTQSTIPGEAGLTGCWVFGPNSIYVVGGSVYKSTDGQIWKDVIPSTNSGSLSGQLSGASMFGFNENDYWLVAGDNLFHVLNGFATYYSFGPSTVPGRFHSCWGTSSSDMYAVGDGGTILHFDGSTWTKMQSGTTYNITDIWGTADNNIWAAGYHQSINSSVLLHFDGSTWKPIDLSLFGPNIISYSIGEAWTCDSAGHHKAYASGSFLYRNSDNSSLWISDSGKLANAAGGGYVPLNFIRGNGWNDYMVEGGSGFLSHWNGRSWYFYQSMFNYGDGGFDTYAFSFVGNTACQVGTKDGPGWVVIGQR
jgi:hypothetical protein